MKFLGNILWLILGGIIIALIYYIVGLLFAIWPSAPFSPSARRSAKLYSSFMAIAAQASASARAWWCILRS